MICMKNCTFVKNWINVRLLIIFNHEIDNSCIIFNLIYM